MASSGGWGVKRGRASVDIKILFARNCGDRTRSYGYELKQGNLD